MVLPAFEPIEAIVLQSRISVRFPPGAGVLEPAAPDASARGVRAGLLGAVAAAIEGKARLHHGGGKVGVRRRAMGEDPAVSITAARAASGRAGREQAHHFASCRAATGPRTRGALTRLAPFRRVNS